MAKPLIFKINNQEYGLEPVKLERKKLYGSKEKEIIDSNGNLCTAASISTEYNLILPRGSTSLGIVDSDGSWVEKSELIAVDDEGNEVEKVASSFDAPIELEKRVTIEEYLSHNITAVYTLQGEENALDFVKEIQDSDEIYTFDFNYRADYEADPAFIVENDGELFVLVGKKIEFEFIGIDEVSDIDETDEEIEEDEFDFGMM